MNDIIVAEIKRRLPKPGRRIVFVCGLGGVGKTEFCRRYAQQPGLEGPILHLDWYLKYSSMERRRRMAEAVMSEDPARIESEENPIYWQDWPATISAIKTLRDTGELRVENGWDQHSGEKSFATTIHADANAVIWCDLVALLHPELTTLADVIILLEVAGEARNARGGARDQHRSDPAYLAYKAAVTKKYDMPYFQKYRKAAHIIVDNTDLNNPKIVA